MSATVTIDFLAPADAAPGDYAQLFSNGGDGAIDYDTPADAMRYDLAPNGARTLGFGEGPYGLMPFGDAVAAGLLGYGEGPYGVMPFGGGCLTVRIEHRVDRCGAYRCAVRTFDALGNPQPDPCEELPLPIHIAPPAPTARPTKVSYNRATDVLVLNI